jgi:hypothetical protein
VVGYGDYWHFGIKDRVVELAGDHARNPHLRSSEAYDLAYEQIYQALPDCRRCACG